MVSQFELIKKNGLSIRGNLGQHLLMDSNIQRKIVNLLDPKVGENIIEIGPGLGAITGEILKREAKVWAIEMDKRFVSILEEEFQAVVGDRLKVFHDDILKFNFSQILEKIQPESGRIRVVSNLPYYITAPILMRLIEHRGFFSEAVLMMQKEVCQRLLANPGTKDYGRLTLAVRYYADVEQAFTITANCFRPKPEVDSSVIRLRFHADHERYQDIDAKWLFYLIRTAFSQRRKTLLNLLTHDPNISESRKDLEALFEKNGWLSTVRGEELLLKDFMQLSRDLKKGL